MTDFDLSQSSPHSPEVGSFCGVKYDRSRNTMSDNLQDCSQLLPINMAGNLCWTKYTSLERLQTNNTNQSFIHKECSYSCIFFFPSHFASVGKLLFSVTSAGKVKKHFECTSLNTFHMKFFNTGHHSNMHMKNNEKLVHTFLIKNLHSQNRRQIFENKSSRYL